MEHARGRRPRGARAIALRAGEAGRTPRAYAGARPGDAARRKPTALGDLARADGSDGSPPHSLQGASRRRRRDRCPVAVRETVRVDRVRADSRKTSSGTGARERHGTDERAARASPREKGGSRETTNPKRRAPAIRRGASHARRPDAALRDGRTRPDVPFALARRRGLPGPSSAPGRQRQRNAARPRGRCPRAMARL